MIYVESRVLQMFSSLEDRDVLKKFKMKSENKWTDWWMCEYAQFV